MVEKEMKTEQLLRTLADEKTVKLLQAVRDKEKSKNLNKGMSRKEFYSRMARLKALGLVRMSKGYHITPLGRIVILKILDATAIICKSYWSLKAMDVLTGEDIPEEELQEVASTLIKDMDLQRALS
jgi:hypothetical protein